MVMRGFDISNYQAGLDIISANPDFVIVKATEGIGFTDPTCDKFVQKCLSNDIPFGFYHFARSNNACEEANYFYQETQNYVNLGIPILDFEVLNSNEWLETWCKTYYELSNVYPWIYMNSDYINNRGYGTEWLKKNCGLWLAGYPTTYTTYPDNSTPPYNHEEWLLAAWQFTSNLAINGFSIDGDFFYGDINAWNAYAKTSSNTNKTVLQLATETIYGQYGNGVDRKVALGNEYDNVQNFINELYKKAYKVIRGDYGNGADRRAALGNEYDIIQYIVNNIIQG